MSSAFDHLILSETVLNALELAAAERPTGQPLQTGRLLEALDRVDSLGDWSRLWLNAGQPSALSLAQVLDNPTTAENEVAARLTTWHGVPLSPALTSALNTLAVIAERYSMVPVQPGALALALLSDPTAGSTATLLRSGGISHYELLKLVQSDLLGTSLNGLEEVLAAACTADNGTTPAWMAAVDDIGLFCELAPTQPVAGVLATAGFDPDFVTDLASELRHLPTRSASDIIDTATAQSVTGQASELQVFAEMTEHPSTALRSALRLGGVDGPELAVEASTRIAADHGRKPSISAFTYVLTLFNVVAMIAVLILLIRHSIGPGSLWELLLIPFVFTGPPSSTTLSSLITAVVYYFLCSPLVGISKLVETAIGTARSLGERRDTLALTGVKLTERQQRRRAIWKRGGYRSMLAAQNLGLLPWRLRRLEARVLRAKSASAEQPRT